MQLQLAGRPCDVFSLCAASREEAKCGWNSCICRCNGSSNARLTLVFCCTRRKMSVSYSTCSLKAEVAPFLRKQRHLMDDTCITVARPTCFNSKHTILYSSQPVQLYLCFREHESWIIILLNVSFTFHGDHNTKTVYPYINCKTSIWWRVTHGNWGYIRE